MQNLNCPYSDDYLRYDKLTGHLVLTEKALVESVGLDLRSRLGEGATVNPEVVINRFLQLISDMVYGFIHEHNMNNKRQDEIIAKTASGREIIKRAMEYQALYVANVGNLSYSTKQEERAAAIDETCKTVLNTTIPEIGVCILYTGRLT